MVQATIPQEVGKITGIGRRSKLLVESGDKELILMKKIGIGVSLYVLLE